MKDMVAKVNCWSAVPELIRVPKWWFLDPVRASMRKLVRPCTHLTRRKQLTVKFQMPLRCFYELMAPLMDGDTQGLQRDDQGRLVPTKVTNQLRYYSYILRRGSLVDKFFALHVHEKPLAGLGKKAWRRCLGSRGAALYRRRGAATRHVSKCDGLRMRQCRDRVQGAKGISLDAAVYHQVLCLEHGRAGQHLVLNY